METLSTLFPTDNLYKFLALTGLITIGVCLFYMDANMYRLDEQISEIENKREFAEHEISLHDLSEKRDSIRVVRLEKYSDKLIEGILQNTDITSNDLSLAIYSSEQIANLYLFNIINNSKKNIDKNYYKTKISLFVRIRRLEDSISTKGIDNGISRALKYETLNQALSKMQFQLKRLGTIIFYSSIGMVVGLFVAIYGFTNWYMLLQNPQDKIADLQLKELEDKLRGSNKIILP